MDERESRLVRCACCQSGRKTLLKREGKYVCRDCYAAVLRIRLMQAVERREG